tara:strand:- start:380 stop:577 length:198 start_codon:yes stop_codon:yes gene_type:complete
MNTYQELIDSVRESRRRMSEKFDHDPDRYIAYLKSLNGKYATQVESFQKLSDFTPTEKEPVSSPE